MLKKTLNHLQTRSFLKTPLKFFPLMFIILFLPDVGFGGNVFNSLRQVEIEKGVRAMTSADVNNDGILDVVSVINAENSQPIVNISLGKGNGNFKKVNSYETFGGIAYCISSGDFNNDGKTDIAVGTDQSITGFNLTVFFGNGDGSLQSKIGYNVGNGVEVHALSVNDFDGDKKLDLAVGESNDFSQSSVAILQNDGDGYFQQVYTTQMIGILLLDMTIADFNNDGILDIAVAQGATTVSVLYGNSNVTFQSPINFSVSNPIAITNGDFNNDGKLDLAVVGAHSTNTINIFLNTSGGFPTTPQTYSINANIKSITTADFDEDGNLDLAVSDDNSNTVFVSYGSSSGTFTTFTGIQVTGTPVKLLSGDLNNDNNIDLVVGSGSDDGNILLNRQNQITYYGDFTGDRVTDISVFNPGVPNWQILSSSGGNYSVQFGLSTDKIVPGNYDGEDAKADISVFRNGDWYILRSVDNTVSTVQFGLSGDIPIPADYTNDGKTNIAVFRPSNGIWYIKTDSNVIYQSFGLSSDLPIPGDYDGDGYVDIAVFRPSGGEWHILKSTTGYVVQSFGLNGDRPVQADYDHDGKVDLAVFRPSNATWYIFQSSDSSAQTIQFGQSSDIPVPGEYTGDNITDIAVFNNGQWKIRKSQDASTSTFQWGQSGDAPIPGAYIP